MFGSIWQLFGSHMPIEGSEKGDIADGDMSADFMPGRVFVCDLVERARKPGEGRRDRQ
ncbi:MAG: hypothetical protein KIG22_02310 [Oxalobacter sp.]|uniref:hypothetical protein n=1 Tax=Oxalobacter paeniformigenes TaxID=2946594 RepID=UPI0022AFCB43|nr:hypothetical protein [Oxalobacter paeniformigenes]MBS7404762.1 hypothetical protein [Oxalobacter sp.]MCZ4052843.1 hypothetical protein [Oxalobacter paeniformigenes]